MSELVKELTDAGFQKEVLESATPVLVDFWAPWCGPCRMMVSIVTEIAKQYQGRVKVGKLNTDDNSNTASQYHISAIPTIILFKDGKVVEQVVGVRSREDLASTIEKYL